MFFQCIENLNKGLGTFGRGTFGGNFLEIWIGFNVSMNFYDFLET
jgi:hypothetical protein